MEESDPFEVWLVGVSISSVVALIVLLAYALIVMPQQFALLVAITVGALIIPWIVGRVVDPLLVP